MLDKSIFIINSYLSNTLKIFAKNSFLMVIGSIIGLANISIASKTLGLAEYGNFINFNILAQAITGFSVLGLSELSVKYFYSNYGLKKHLNFIFIAFFQIISSLFIVIFICLFTNTNLILFIPFYLALLLVQFVGIFLRAKDSIIFSNIANSLFFNLVILFTILIYPDLDHKFLLNSFSIVTFTIFFLVLPFILRKLIKKSLYKPLINKKLIQENFSIGALVILHGFFATIDQIFVSRVFGLDELALYKITLIIFFAGSFPHVVINTIAGPRVARICFKKKFKTLSYLLKKITKTQIVLSILSVIAVYFIINFSGELIFNYESKPSLISYFFMALASCGTSVRGVSTIILIQNNKIAETFIGQLIYIVVLTISFSITYVIFPNIVSILFSFAFSHLTFSYWILKKTNSVINKNIKYENL